MPINKDNSEAPGLVNNNDNSSNNSNNSNNSNSNSKGDNDSVAFSKWRESNINDDDYNRDDTQANNDADDSSDSDDDPAVLFRMFGEEDEEDVYEEVRYDYEIPLSSVSPSSSTTTVVIRHHGAYPNSTGLAVWRGAEILARFICDQQLRCDTEEAPVSVSVADAVAMRHKKVLEVGSGAGLPGIVAHRVLGAERVLVTDGDYDALNNLKFNVDANRSPKRGDDDTVTPSTTTNTTISCQQLIWGKAVDAFLENHGKQDVVLAADCVYMVPSLKPLWATIDALLQDDGVFVYAQTAASAVPWKDFSEMVQLHGFETCCEVTGKDVKKYDIDNDDDDDDDHHEAEEYEQGIYVFRRRR